MRPSPDPRGCIRPKARLLVLRLPLQGARVDIDVAFCDRGPAELPFDPCARAMSEARQQLGIRDQLLEGRAQRIRPARRHQQGVVADDLGAPVPSQVTMAWPAAIASSSTVGKFSASDVKAKIDERS